MAEIYELFDSRRYTNHPFEPIAALRFIILHAADQDEADNILVAALPATFEGLVVDRYENNPQGGGVWIAEATYGPVRPEQLGEAYGPGTSPPPPSPPPPPPPTEHELLDASYSFDTTGGTQHITQSIRTRSSAGIDGAAAPDFEGAIGVSSQGVQGADVPAARLALNIEREVPGFSLSYVRLVRDLTSHTNDAPFLGFDTEEVLFLGASGTRASSESTAKIKYGFLVGKNLTNVEIVEARLTLASVKAHDHVWAYYGEDTDADELIQRPKAAYAEQVAGTADLSKLRL